MALAQAFLDSKAEIDIHRGSAGAATDLAIQPDCDCRPPGRFGQIRGNYPDDAGVPILAGCPHQRGVETSLLRLPQGFLGNQGNEFTPFNVQRIELLCDHFGRFAIFCAKQHCSEMRLSQPAAGIDPRGKLKAQIHGVRRCRKSGQVGESGQPGALPAAHHRQPLPYECPVQTRQRNNVRDSGKRNDIEHLHQVGSAQSLRFHEPIHGHKEKKHDAGGAQVTKIRGFVLTIGIYHCNGLRQLVQAAMVIKHDDVRRRRRDRFERRSSAVDAHDQLVILGKLLHCLDVGSVALGDPVRNVGCRYHSVLAKPQAQERRRACSVDIVVREYRNLLPLSNCRNESPAGHIHIEQFRRIRHKVP